jgi:hypothetical protein
MTQSHRHNLSAFMARFAALGICASEFSTCAVELFRETLETPRRLTAADDGNEFSVAELLLACGSQTNVRMTGG